MIEAGFITPSTSDRMFKDSDRILVGQSVELLVCVTIYVVGYLVLIWAFTTTQLATAFLEYSTRITSYSAITLVFLFVGRYYKIGMSKEKMHS